VGPSEAWTGIVSWLLTSVATLNPADLLDKDKSEQQPPKKPGGE
jgi:hypothetical protein